MRGRLADVLKGAVVVLAVALVAASLPHLEGGSLETQLLFALGGGFASAVVVLLVRAARPIGRQIGNPTAEPSMYRGMKIGFVGFCLAVLGWLVAVFISGVPGFWLVVLGVAIGFVGIIIHFVAMFAPRNRSDA